jgi:tetrahydromethanopterin S-methyltransferase subunit F
VAGATSAAGLGVAISVMRLPTLRDSIAGLYGLEGVLVAGWTAHLVHGAIFGTIFALVLADPALYRVPDREWKSVAAGIVYGVVLSIVGAGVIMPIWLDAAGLAAPAIPNVTVASLLWHLLYGAVLGALFPAVEGL